jgi:hypothetical protein
MFLGGSYHDRDNPHMWGVSHGQLIVFIRTLVCNQKDGRQRSSSSRGLQTSMDDLMMMMMMMTIFYRGIGTKPTGTKNSNTAMVVDDDDDDDGVDDGYNKHNTHNNTDDGRSKTKDGGNQHHDATTPTGTTDDGTTTATKTTMAVNDDDDNHTKNDNCSHSRQSMTASNRATTKDAQGARDDGATTRTRTPTDGINKQGGRMTMTMGMTMTIKTMMWMKDEETVKPSATGTLLDRTTSSMPLHQDQLDRHEMRTTTRRTDGRTNKQGRMTTMGMTETIPPATGTLDRKTSQASPKACLYNQHKTREA